MPGQTKWVSVDPRSGALTQYDEDASAHLESAWSTMQSTAEIAKLNAVVFFDSRGYHVQKTRRGERCVRCVKAGDTVVTRAFRGDGYRIVDVVASGQPTRQLMAPGVTPIVVV